MKYKPKKNAKKQLLLYLGLLLGLVLLVPIYLVLSRWTHVAGMDVLYIFLCSLAVLILYFFPQLLFWQNIGIDANNVYVTRSGILPDKLVFPKSDVAYTRLDCKDGTALSQQWKDPEPGSSFAVAFVLKNGTKVTSDKMDFDPEDFKEFQKILPNFVTAEEVKHHNPSSGKKVSVRHSRYFIFAVFGVLLLLAAYIAYEAAFAGGMVW